MGFERFGRRETIGRTMNHADAQGWIDRYLAAWKTNDRDDITALFAEDVEYRYHPFDEPILGGRAGVVDSWLEDTDPPEAWDAEYFVHAVDGNKVVATGSTRYFATDKEQAKVYYNCFLIDLDDDGRCTSFTEYYIRE